MKTILTIVCMSILTGCMQDADVISSDGSHDLGICNSGDWSTCIEERCPNGFNVVRKPTDNNKVIIKCKPSCDEKK